MKRRWRLWLALASLLLIGVAVVQPAVHWRLIGWARGEAFYQGRPTRHWTLECQQRECRFVLQPCARVGHTEWLRHPTRWEKQFSWLVGTKPAATMPLLSGDPTAALVLVELLRDEAPETRRIAITG